MKTFLAWQTHSNESRHLRKYDENGKFICWEPQGYAAMEWMEKNGNPEYPNCHLLDGAFGIDEPYETDEVKPDTVNEGMME